MNKNFGTTTERRNFIVDLLAAGENGKTAQEKAKKQFGIGVSQEWLSNYVKSGKASKVKREVVKPRKLSAHSKPKQIEMSFKPEPKKEKNKSVAFLKSAAEAGAKEVVFADGTIVKF